MVRFPIHRFEPDWRRSGRRTMPDAARAIPVWRSPRHTSNLATRSAKSYLDTLRLWARGLTVRAFLIALVVIASVGLAAERGGPPGGSERLWADEPFLEPHPVVVASDRLVCSLLGEQGEAAGVRGMDTGGTVEIDGRMYWTFGDTVLADGDQIPNHLSWSEGQDASGCVQMNLRNESGRAAELLPFRLGSELSVWPLGMEATSTDTVHFYYASVVEDAESEWRVQGVGIGSFDTETLVATRALDGALVWPEGTPLPTRTFTDGEYVYTFNDISREPWTRDTILGRVPLAEVESPERYEYWNDGTWVGDLWDAELGVWDKAIDDITPLWRQGSMHNGIEVAYNEFLDRWLAVYSTGFMSSLSARAAEDLTGPWDGPETSLVNCSAFHPGGGGFACYSGAQHEFYTRDGGRTIYVSYSNEGSYQPYLHEVRLAAPVEQVVDGAGRALYTSGDANVSSYVYTEDGLTFYASDVAAPGFSPIYLWRQLETGATRYGATVPWPAADYQALGIAFYAPVDAASSAAAQALHEPVYFWSRGDTIRYSPLNLAPAGFIQERVAFYAPCPDSDGDALTDCFETFLGSDPAISDTDGDGLTDGYELATAGCEPLVFDVDGDWFDGPHEVLLGRNPCLADDPQYVSRR